MELLTSLLLAAGFATALAPASPPLDNATSDGATLSQLDELSRRTGQFPNERHRMRGAASAERGDWADAMREFKEAARYADKYSQHRISLMYWHGQGVERNPALAYAWADVAAERMYPNLVVLREKMWLALSDDERKRAIEEGGALYDRYGDQVAKPRLAGMILRQNSEITGSRAGYVDGRLGAYSPGVGSASVQDRSSGEDTSVMYEQWRLDPKRYWAVEDAVWKGERVNVGSPRKVEDTQVPE